MPVGFFYSSILLSLGSTDFDLSVLDLSILNRRQSNGFFCLGLHLLVLIFMCQMFVFGASQLHFCFQLKVVFIC